MGSCYLMKETPSSLDSGFVLVNVVCYARGAPGPHAGLPCSHIHPLTFQFNVHVAAAALVHRSPRVLFPADVSPRHSAELTRWRRGNTVMPPPPSNWPPVPFQPPPVGAGCSNELLTLDVVELYSARAGSLASQKVESFSFSAVNFHYNIEVPPDTQRMRVVATSLSRREFVDIDLGSFGQVDPCMRPAPTSTTPTRSATLAPQHIRSLAQGMTRCCVARVLCSQSPTSSGPP